MTRHVLRIDQRYAAPIPRVTCSTKCPCVVFLAISLLRADMYLQFRWDGVGQFSRFQAVLVPDGRRDEVLPPVLVGQPALHQQLCARGISSDVHGVVMVRHSDGLLCLCGVARCAVHGVVVVPQV